MGPDNTPYFGTYAYIDLSMLSLTVIYPHYVWVYYYLDGGYSNLLKASLEDGYPPRDVLSMS